MKSEHKQGREFKQQMQDDPGSVERSEQASREDKTRKAIQHIKDHPDGCADWCHDCEERLRCKNERHEWPRDYSDGDTCFCGQYYLFVNNVDGRPYIIERDPDSDPS
jgi:hypothetical protein